LGRALLLGLLLVGLGIAGLFVAVATAANAGVPAHKAGLAAALVNASQWLGGALGLAIFTAVSTSRTNHRLAAGTPHACADVRLPARAARRERLILASTTASARPRNPRSKRSRRLRSRPVPG
jgi:MFS family permease